MPPSPIPGKFLVGKKLKVAASPKVAISPGGGPGAEGLGAVLHHPQAVRAGQVHDRRHVGRVAEDVDRQDRPRRGADARLDRRGVEAVGDRVDVAEDRRGAHPGDGLGRGVEGVRGGDDLVARPDVQGVERDDEGVGAVGDARAGPAAEALRDGRLQGPPLGAEDEAPAVEHPRDGGVDLGGGAARTGPRCPSGLRASDGAGRYHPGDEARPPDGCPRREGSS